MEILDILVPVVFQLGLTLGVGASTFALTFYILATKDGTIDDSEKHLMHAVYTVLRVGMGLIALGLLGSLLGGYLAGDAVYWMFWTLLIVITLNAILMTKHMMPMQYGPVLAGGSWYSLFFLDVLPFSSTSYPMLLLYYAGFLVLFYLGFSYIKKLNKPAQTA